VGRQSLQLNTGGSYNIGIGAVALQNNTSGSNNVGIGASSITSNTTGYSNSALGASTLLNNTSGYRNTALGAAAGYSNSTGNNNVFVGYGAGYQDPNATSFATLGNLQNAAAIGNGAQVQQSNSLILGGVGTVASNLTPNVGIGTTAPTNLFSISPNIYDTGTASTTASATVVGSGTTWTSNMVGMEFIFANGNKYTITNFTDATHMTLSASSTNTSQAYRIHNPAFYVTNTGNAALRSSTNSSTAFQIQNAAGATQLNFDSTGSVLTLSPTGATFKSGIDASGSVNSGFDQKTINDTFVAGRYAYTASGGSTTACSQSVSAIGCELKVFDVADPQNPVYVGGADAGGSTNSNTFGRAFNAVKVIGRYAYVAASGSAATCSSTAGSANGCDLMVFDISNPSAPTYIGGADADGTTNGGSSSIDFNDLAINGT
jgi:hypothetical protein